MKENVVGRKETFVGWWRKKWRFLDFTCGAHAKICGSGSKSENQKVVCVVEFSEFRSRSAVPCHEYEAWRLALWCGNELQKGLYSCPIFWFLSWFHTFYSVGGEYVSQLEMALWCYSLFVCFEVHYFHIFSNKVYMTNIGTLLPWQEAKWWFWHRRYAIHSGRVISISNLGSCFMNLGYYWSFLLVCCNFWFMSSAIKCSCRHSTYFRGTISIVLWLGASIVDILVFWYFVQLLFQVHRVLAFCVKVVVIAC